MKKSSDFSKFHCNENAAKKIFFDSENSEPWFDTPSPKSGVKVGSVLQERLYQALKYEVYLFPLKEDNWEFFLKYGNLDIVIIESVIEDYSGHWDMSFIEESNDIDKLIELSKSLGIPTVFWMTKGIEYCDFFKEKIDKFDFVFCADEKAVEYFYEINVHAEYLGPSAQEKIYNPVKKNREKKVIDVLVENWVDLDKSENFRELVHSIDFCNLFICESQYIIFKKRFLSNLGDISGESVGKMSYSQRVSRLKDSKIKLVSASSHLTEINLIWECLEAVASGCLVVVYGEFSVSSYNKLFITCDSFDDVTFEIKKLLDDDFLRQKLSVISMRNFFYGHTYSHRLKKIFERSGVDFKWEEFPKVSFIVPTIRPELLSSIYRTFDKQAYPNKELVVVFNSNQSLKDLVGADVEKDPRVKVSKIPSDYFTGGALNLAIKISDGEYVIKQDDDDFYFENYALDMMMWAKISNADFFGKNSAPLVFEGDETLYCKRRQELPGFLTREDLQGGVWISGNSLSGKKSFFEKVVKFSNEGYGAVDSIFYLSLPINDEVRAFLCDPFNMAALRMNDTSKHTWRADADQLKKNRVALPSVEEYRV